METDTVIVVRESEVFKAGIHLCLFGLAATVASYNTMKLSQRFDWHHAINVAVYTALVAFEYRQIRQHLS